MSVKKESSAGQGAYGDIMIMALKSINHGRRSCVAGCAQLRTEGAVVPLTSSKRAVFRARDCASGPGSAELFSVVLLRTLENTTENRVDRRKATKLLCARSSGGGVHRMPGTAQKHLPKASRLGAAPRLCCGNTVRATAAKTATDDVENINMAENLCVVQETVKRGTAMKSRFDLDRRCQDLVLLSQRTKQRGFQTCYVTAGGRKEMGQERGASTLKYII